MVAEPGGSLGWYSNSQGRFESSGGQLGIQRSRDGVPIWNGEPGLLEEFTEACLRYEPTVVREKRYLCGPRIANELRGPARRVLLGRSADWLSYDGGVRLLIEVLREERGQPKIPEMSELLMKYFKGTRRQRGETMSDYVTRKAEAYTRAQQSMARFQQSGGTSQQSQSASWTRKSTRSSQETGSGPGSKIARPFRAPWMRRPQEEEMVTQPMKWRQSRRWVVLGPRSAGMEANGIGLLGIPGTTETDTGIGITTGLLKETPQNGRGINCQRYSLLSFRVGTCLLTQDWM